MFLPLNVDVPMNRPPIANWILIGVIAGISLVAWGNAAVFEFLVGEAPSTSNAFFNPPLWKMPLLAFIAAYSRGVVRPSFSRTCAIEYLPASADRSLSNCRNA